MPDASKTITIKLPDDFGADNATNLRAYVVGSQGNVVETSRFSDLVTHLTATAQTLKTGRVFIGPSFPEEFPPESIDAYRLADAGAYQVSTRGANEEIALEHIPSAIRVHPPFRFCNVQGNVTNTLTVDGLTQSGPLCQARVHICQVDWYFRWPIWLRPVVPLAIIDRLQQTILAQRAQPDRFAATSQTRLPTAVEDQILAATPETIHEVASRIGPILYPYLCRYPFFWPWFYRIIEEDVVYTDCNGHFDDWLFSLGVNNIYVWVEANINGTWVTVYNPPYPCNTRWDYACGTEINISIANPAIPPCNCDTTVVDGSVWFTGIGAYGIANNIQQSLTSTVAIAVGSGAVANIPNAGCTTLFDPYGNQLAPFGDLLNLNLATGPTLPATHYLWRWRYVQNSAGAAMSGAPTAITGAVSRPYLYPLADGSWQSGTYPLNDTDANGVTAYLLPEYLPTAYGTVPPLAEWVSFNFVSAALDSHQFLDGYVVQFSLELYNKVNDVFEPVSPPDNTFQVSNSTDSANGYDGSSPASSDYLSVDADGNTIFTLNVRIDNSPVTAHLNDAWLLDGSGNQIPGGNSGPCGFITFTSASQNVSLSFVASGAFNYAYFSYSLIKGDTGGIIGIPSDNYVFDKSVAFTLNGVSYAFSQTGGSGTFSAAPTATDLLTGCPQAAFAESLTVYSLATDGSGQLWQTVGGPYAASSGVAFALTPG